MKKIFFIVTFLVFFYIPNIYANNDGIFDDGKTIKDLRKDIEDINQNSIEVELKIKDFLNEHNIYSYFKKWLNQKELVKIKWIIDDYIIKKYDLDLKNKKLKKEEDLIKIQNSFIDLKKNLYKSLTFYIEPKNYKDYLFYVENDLKNFVEKNNLHIIKSKTEKNYSKKVDILEKKIYDNKKNLDLEIKKLIDQKLDEKISWIIDSPSFLKLNSSEKIKTLQKVIDNLNIRINSFKTNLDSNSIYLESERKKIEIYKTMVKKLKEVSNNIK